MEDFTSIGLFFINALIMVTIQRTFADTGFYILLG